MNQSSIKETDVLVTPNEDTLDQSVALNKIAMEMLKSKRREDFWLRIILLVSLCVNLLIVGLFLLYESQFTTTETTVTTTVEQDTGEGEGNNVYQAGENAQYIQGNGVLTDGETDSSYNDNNTHTDE